VFGVFRRRWVVEKGWEWGGVLKRVVVFVVVEMEVEGAMRVRMADMVVDVGGGGGGGGVVWVLEQVGVCVGGCLYVREVSWMQDDDARMKDQKVDLRETTKLTL
jgi:hypothetical protein